MLKISRLVGERVEKYGKVTKVELNVMGESYLGNQSLEGDIGESLFRRKLLYRRIV